MTENQRLKMIDSILHSRMHDLNGDGQWTDDELKALFQKQLDEVYDPNNKVWPLPQLIPNSFFLLKKSLICLEWLTT